MSEKSPYRSADVSPDTRRASPKRSDGSQARNSGLYGGSPAVIKTKHQWSNMGGRGGAHQTTACRLCGSPKFVVDGLPCHGKKKA